MPEVLAEESVALEQTSTGASTLMNRRSFLRRSFVAVLTLPLLGQKTEFHRPLSRARAPIPPDEVVRPFASVQNGGDLFRQPFWLPPRHETGDGLRIQLDPDLSLSINGRFFESREAHVNNLPICKPPIKPQQEGEQKQEEEDLGIPLIVEVTKKNDSFLFIIDGGTVAVSEREFLGMLYELHDKSHMRDIFCAPIVCDIQTKNWSYQFLLSRFKKPYRCRMRYKAPPAHSDQIAQN